MGQNLPHNNEIVLSKRDIDFSASTVNKITKNLLNQIEQVSQAICESPQTFKLAIEQGRVVIGAYSTSYGNKLIYIHFDEHDYVVPYIVNH